MIDNDIINSVQVPQLVKDSFFQNGILEKDHRDRPIHYSGGFAIVFVFIVDGKNGRLDVGGINQKRILHIDYWPCLKSLRK